MIKTIVNYIRFLAAVALIGAGVIHTFPYVWLKWDFLVRSRPGLHFGIGLTGFILGIGNLSILLYYMYIEYSRKK